MAVAKYVLLAVVLYCVYRAMRVEFSKVSRDDVRQLAPDWLLVTLAGLCLAGMNTVQMLRYRSLLFAYGAKPTWMQMTAIAWIPPLGKYLPFSVWSLVGAIAMLKRFGINITITVSVVILVDAFGELMGLILSVPLLMRPPLGDLVPGGALTAPVLLSVGVIALSPPVMGRLVQLALRWTKRPPLSRLPGWGEYVVPVTSAFAQYLFAGAALWLMTRAITPVTLSQLPWFVMIAACAMAVGYLIFIMPGGLGVREFIFITLLPPLLPHAPAGTIAIVTLGMRLLQIAAELALAGLGWVALGRSPAVTATARPS